MKRSTRRDAGRPRGEAVATVVMLCTLEELASHGFANLSIERIAAAAEVNKTTVYRRWPTREALVAGALEFVLVDFETVEDTGSLKGDLLALAQQLATFISEPAGKALARAAFAESSAPEIAAVAAAQFARGAAPRVSGLVERAMKRGEWKASIPHEAAMSMLVGAILHRVLLEHQPASGRWLEAIVDVLATGLTAPRA